MKKMIYSRFAQLLMLCSIVLMNSCIPAAKPLFIDSDFHVDKIKEIVVLPVVDLRTDKALEIEKVDKWRVRAFKMALTRSKYTAVFDNDRTYVDSITEEILQDLNSEWIKSLYTEKNRWIMVPILYGSYEQSDIARKVQLEIGAYLFDTHKGKRIWFHKDFLKCSGGLLMPGVMHDCIQTSYWSLALHLPKQQ